MPQPKRASIGMNPFNAIDSQYNGIFEGTLNHQNTSIINNDITFQDDILNDNRLRISRPSSRILDLIKPQDSPLDNTNENFFSVRQLPVIDPIYNNEPMNHNFNVYNNYNNYSNPLISRPASTPLMESNVDLYHRPRHPQSNPMMFPQHDEPSNEVNRFNDIVHSPNKSYYQTSGTSLQSHRIHSTTPQQIHQPIHRSHSNNANIGHSLNQHRHSAAPQIPNSNRYLDHNSVEQTVANSCQDILKEASTHSLKAVELANTLRARVGTEILAFVREHWGGLLSLLEKRNDLFRVDRIPKNDIVTLISMNSNRQTNNNLWPVDNKLNDDSHTGILGNVSKCLHVGNVPPLINETDLMKEFEKYGIVEQTKLINQRGRRFAFVCYQTIEMAITAKTMMSRVHPWKSAISFAHKESINSYNNNQYGNYSNEFDESFNYMPSLRPSTSLGQSTNMNRGGLIVPPNRSMSLSPSVMLGEGDHDSGDISYENENMNSYSIESNNYSNRPINRPITNNSFHYPNTLNPVLKRLCDDTYVPTQPWPIDSALDSPYCNAIVMQLLQFGGSTSISKLRGFLRTRINAPDNVKSVPLKALLAAYPQLFYVRNNQVTLLSIPSNLNIQNSNPIEGITDEKQVNSIDSDVKNH
eukprot:gene20182-26200_t